MNEGCVTSGVNASTKAQKRKIDSNKLDLSLPTVSYADIYMYVKKKWIHKGKGCMLCNTIMNDPYVLEHHHYVCEINKQKSRRSLDD